MLQDCAQGQHGAWCISPAPQKVKVPLTAACPALTCDDVANKTFHLPDWPDEGLRALIEWKTYAVAGRNTWAVGTSGKKHIPEEHKHGRKKLGVVPSTDTSAHHAEDRPRRDCGDISREMLFIGWRNTFVFRREVQPIQFCASAHHVGGPAKERLRRDINRCLLAEMSI